MFLALIIELKKQPQLNVKLIKIKIEKYQQIRYYARTASMMASTIEILLDINYGILRPALCLKLQCCPLYKNKIKRKLNKLSSCLDCDLDYEVPSRN